MCRAYSSLFLELTSLMRVLLSHDFSPSRNVQMKLGINRIGNIEIIISQFFLISFLLIKFADTINPVFSYLLPTLLVSFFLFKTKFLMYLCAFTSYFWSEYQALENLGQAPKSLFLNDTGSAAYLLHKKAKSNNFLFSQF